MGNNKYKNAIEILTSSDVFHINLGLERITKILDLLGNPQDDLKFIHIAGTNGKGSVCSILNTVLQHNGFNVGMYTSPHIFNYTERIKFNSKDISNTEFADILFKIVNLAKVHSIKLTEFEILTCIAFVYFKNCNTDIVILETGLGGRYDATNVIGKNICSVITNIALEHTDRLGDTIDKIAFEKAGIIKNGCPIFVSEDNCGISVIEKIANEKLSKVYKVKNIDKTCSLKGLFQEKNLSLAVSVLELLNIQDIDTPLKYVKNPLRFEYLKDYNILIDVAHNPDGIKALRKSLDFYYPNKRFNFIFGCLNTKAYEEMLDLLLTDEDKLYVYEFSHKNSCSYVDLDSVSKIMLYPFSLYKEEKGVLTVVCGSFYMLKELFHDLKIQYKMM